LRVAEIGQEPSFVNATEQPFDWLLHTETVNFPCCLVPVIGSVQRELPLLVHCCRESPYSLTPAKEAVARPA
jgi:hypothetical protein